MAQNEATLYGRDIRCVSDADELFTEVVGIEVVRQDAIHRITTDDILGDDGTGSFFIRGWGYDVRKLLGMPARKIRSQQPLISAALLNDPRIYTADVRLTPTTVNGLADVRIEIECTTALGPFSLIRLVCELTAADLVTQP